MTQLESAMEGLIKVFHSYSSKEGDKYKLSKVELKNLLQGELGDFLALSVEKCTDTNNRLTERVYDDTVDTTYPYQHWKCLQFASQDPLVVEKIMTDLDENRDGEVDFQEFVILVAALTVACNEFFVKSLNH